MESEALVRIRRGILALVALGTAGMCAELVALAHYDEAEQLIPLVLGAAGLLASAGVAWRPRLGPLRAWQFIMLLFVGSGIVGMTLHREAGVERRIEDGAATPVPPLLSPGVLVQLGLLGLLYTYRHPALQVEPFDRA